MDSESDEKRKDSPPPVEFLRPGETQGPPAQDRPAAWVPRPEDYQAPAPTWAPPAATPARSSWHLLAGALLIVAGLVGMASTVYSALNWPSLSDYANFTNNSPELIALSQICALISIWSQAIAILGGVMAVQRRNWRLTVVCAIFSLLTIGFLLEASVLGGLGLILVFVSRRDFLS